MCPKRDSLSLSLKVGYNEISMIDASELHIDAAESLREG